MKHFPASPIDITSVASAENGGFYARTGKRIFDVTIAVLALPIVTPVILLAVAFIKSDGGPGFFCQQRVGIDGQVFKLWKLRTMGVNADKKLAEICAADPTTSREWRLNQKLTEDPRITRFGHFLRATSLDELPQIWNVLLGHMSFVGPRPFMTCQEGFYRAAGGRSYFNVRPGITGPWQISDRGDTAFLGRIKFDNDYNAHIGWLYDLSLIRKTVFVVLKCTGQ